MKFRASFCYPFKPDIIEMGTIEKDRILETFENIPWTEYLNKMKSVKESDIHYAPSLEIENAENKNGLTVSAVDGTEWYIFYKRPKLVKKFFGFKEVMNKDFLTDIKGQSTQDVIMCLNALLRNDLQYLED